MESYSKNQKYLLSSYLLIVGRISFAIGGFILGASIYFGSESFEVENAIKPDPVILEYALIILSIWVVTILISVVIAYGLSCDNCHSKLCLIPHGHKSETKRNWLVSFFFPDDVYEKKLTCFKCNTEYKL